MDAQPADVYRMSICLPKWKELPFEKMELQAGGLLLSCPQN